LGKAELVLAIDGIYSQIIGTHCCGDKGYIHIPLQSIRDVRDQACKFEEEKVYHFDLISSKGSMVSIVLIVHI